MWCARFVTAVWWRPVAGLRCGAGCIRMRFGLGITAVGSSHAIQTAPPRQGVSWISRPAKGRAARWGRRNSSSPPMRRRAFRLGAASTPPTPVVREPPCLWSTSTSAAALGPIWLLGTFLRPESSVAANRRTGSHRWVGGWSKSCPDRPLTKLVASSAASTTALPTGASKQPSACATCIRAWCWSMLPFMPVGSTRSKSTSQSSSARSLRPMISPTSMPSPSAGWIFNTTGRTALHRFNKKFTRADLDQLLTKLKTPR